MRPRLIFFDILRIFLISIIVLHHVSKYMAGNHFVEFTRYSQFLVGNPSFLNIIDLNIGALSVYFLIFVSGAVLEYTHCDLGTFNGIKKFLYRRLTRIYPAYWMTLFLTLVLIPSILIIISIPEFIVCFFGFSAFIGIWNGPFPGVIWFIGLIISLYFMFPILSKSVKIYPHITMIFCVIISIVSLIVISDYQWGGLGAIRWFPLCNLMWFCGGIYIIKNGLFPKNTHKDPALTYVAELSFYVFLIHSAVMYLLKINIVFYIISVILISAGIMCIDNIIQKKLSRPSE